MARIAGVDIPDEKRGEIGLTYIFGVGMNRARKILLDAGVDVNIKVKDWSDEDQVKIGSIITETIKVEGVPDTAIGPKNRRTNMSPNPWYARGNGPPV